MNTNYEKLLRRLDLPSPLVDCAMGRLLLPVAGVVSPPPWYGYPPAFIPFWSEGHIYVGYWRHWFTNRPPSFVKIYVQGGRTVVEYARTTDQLYCYMAIDAIVNNDGIQPEVEQLAQALGLSNLDEIFRNCLNTGNDPKGFVGIRHFQSETPLVSMDDILDYDGWFPRADFSSSIKWWHHCCSLEIEEDVVAAWPTSLPLPSYLIEQPKPQLFRAFLQKDDLRQAWLTLNSAGWSLPDARRAIDQLASTAQDAYFSILADAWLEVSKAELGGY